MKMFRFNNATSVLLCWLLLLAVMHVTHAQEEEDVEVVVVEDSSIANHSNETHYIRGSSSSSRIISTEDFEREMQVRCIARNGYCARTSDCCDPLSCRSNSCQVKYSILLFSIAAYCSRSLSLSHTRNIFLFCFTHTHLYRALLHAAILDPFVTETRIAALVDAVVADAAVLFRAVACWEGFALRDPTAAPAMIVLAEGVGIPTISVDSSGMAACAIPIAAVICLVVKMSVVDPVVA